MYISPCLTPTLSDTMSYNISNIMYILMYTELGLKISELVGSVCTHYPKFQNKVDAYHMSVSISIISRVKGWMSSVIERVKDIFGVCMFVHFNTSYYKY